MSILQLLLATAAFFSGLAVLVAIVMGTSALLGGRTHR
jgi:hypothetical protein